MPSIGPKKIARRDAPETITITVDENGEATLEVNGVEGSSCEILTQELEETLGLTTDKQFKPEYHKKPTNKAAITTRLSQRN